MSSSIKFGGRFKAKAKTDTARKPFNRPKAIKIGKRVLTHVVRYSLIICLSYMLLYPILRMFSLAITHPYVLSTVGTIWVPSMMSFDNFRTAWAVMQFWPHFITTFTHVTLIMILATFNAALAGYAFAKLRFKGMNILFFLALLTFIIPTRALMLPQFVLFRNFDVFGIIALIRGEPLNLLGSPAAMFMMAGMGMGIAGGLFIYIFRQFFRGLPKELEEAAYVDGAGVLRTFFTIVLPMAKPAFMTVGTLSFIWTYNDNHFPSLFNPHGQYLRSRLATIGRLDTGTTPLQLSIAMARTAGTLSPDVTTLPHPNLAFDAAIVTVATLITMAPLIILFLIIQRQFVQGVERSGIVG